MSVNDYKQKSDSVSLAKIGEKAFTIMRIEDSDYTKDDEIKKGVKITTVETFNVDITKDGKTTKEDHSKFHTTRIAIVKFCNNEKLREDLKNGKYLKVKCAEKLSEKGKKYFDLVDG